MNHFAKWAAAICIAVFLSVLSAGAVFAHGSLIESDPADGSVSDAAPKSITLRFSEPVRPLVARLIHPGGHTEVLKDIGEKGDTIVLTLPDTLQNGTHSLSWRVTSSDGHPIGGGLVFSIGAPSAIAPPVEPQGDLTVRSGLWAARLVLMLGLVFGVGGTAFLILIAGQPVARLEWPVGGLLLAGLLATPLLIGFQGLDALGEPLPALLRGDTWSAGLFGTSFGRAAVLGATALVLAYAARQIGLRTGIVLSSLSLLVVGLAVASAGHAATASPTLLTRPALFLHAVAATLWIGALLPLAILFKQTSSGAVLALKRFSAAIPLIVGVLILSGLALAVVQLRTVAALRTTDYGLVLLAKLVLVAALLLLAALNRYRLTKPVLAGSETAARQLRRSILAEVVLGSLIIAVLGLWRFTPPPRALAAAPAALQEITASKDGLSAVLSIHPPFTGPVTVEVRDLVLDGKLLEPLSVSIDLDKPSYGIGPFTRPAQRATAQRYRAEGFVLPLDGFWVVRVTVLVSEFRSVTLMDVFDVSKAR
ncbi:copper transport protein [Rhizobium sp. PP-F2F-G20b]|nr:copper transport protein [Rhizobium sp. PP-F2F-G20b]